MFASRNISVCTKDCICLFVCPTGATDTETGQIDKAKCLDGCRLCVDACPSHAIFLVMEKYAEPEPTNQGLADSMLSLCAGKYEQENIARDLERNAASPAAKKLAGALKRSLRIAAEDCAREAGYMLPQSRAVRELLEKLSKDGEQKIKEITEELLI